MSHKNLNKMMRSLVLVLALKVQALTMALRVQALALSLALRVEVLLITPAISISCLKETATKYHIGSLKAKAGSVWSGKIENTPTENSTCFVRAD